MYFAFSFSGMDVRHGREVYRECEGQKKRGAGRWGGGAERGGGQVSEYKMLHLVTQRGPLETKQLAELAKVGVRVGVLDLGGGRAVGKR